MKLGLLTAAFPQRALGEVAAWAAGAGFEALEIASWPGAHLDVSSFDPDAVLGLLAGHGLEISALAYYPNNLDPDDAAQSALLASALTAVDRPPAGIGRDDRDDPFGGPAVRCRAFDHVVLLSH